MVIFVHATFFLLTWIVKILKCRQFWYHHSSSKSKSYLTDALGLFQSYKSKYMCQMLLISHPYTIKINAIFQSLKVCPLLIPNQPPPIRTLPTFYDILSFEGFPNESIWIISSYQRYTKDFEYLQNLEKSNSQSIKLYLCYLSGQYCFSSLEV